jgi:hypothetical protein
MTNIVTLPRFRVARIEQDRRNFGRHKAGWAVFDGPQRITIRFATREEAEERCQNIAALYARWNWQQRHR